MSGVCPPSRIRSSQFSSCGTTKSSIASSGRCVRHSHTWWPLLPLSTGARRCRPRHLVSPSSIQSARATTLAARARIQTARLLALRGETRFDHPPRRHAKPGEASALLPQRDPLEQGRVDARCLGREPAGSAHASKATYRRSSDPGSSDAHRRRPQTIVSGITQRVSALGSGQRMQIATPGGEVQADLAGPPHSCRYLRPFPSQCAAPLPIPTGPCGRQQSLQVWLWIGAKIRRPRRHHALHGEVELLRREQFANLSS